MKQSRHTGAKSASAMLILPNVSRQKQKCVPVHTCELSLSQGQHDDLGGTPRGVMSESPFPGVAMTQTKFRSLRGLRAATATGAAILLGLSLTSCSVDSTGAGTGGSLQGTGSLNGGGKTIVVFMTSTASVYAADYAKSVRAEAGKLGYTVKIFENKIDQTEEDQQVQQYLASGEVPAAVIWWPSNAKAGIASSRLLSKVAPVIQSNQPIVPGGEEYISAYVGASSDIVGKNMATLAMSARDEAKKAGKALHSAGGNMLAFTWPAGYQSGIARHKAFLDATAAAPFDILQTEPNASGFDAQSAFQAASPVIPKFAGKGIDFVTTQSLGMAGGVITALEQNNLIPSKDLTVIAGADSGSKAPLLSGKVYGAVVQSGIIEGSLAVQTAAKYLAAGKAEDKTLTLEATPDAPELTVEAPAKTTYMPTPPIRAAEIGAFRLWGLSYEQLGTQ
jgi:ABC-type sugar transport system substrate-binding protein